MKTNEPLELGTWKQETKKKKKKKKKKKEKKRQVKIAEKPYRVLQE